MISKARLFLISLVILVLSGCVQVKPQVPLSDAFWQANEKKIAVALVIPEQADFYPMGDIRLLDYAIVMGVMSDVASYSETLELSDFETLGGSLEESLSASGYSVVRIPTFDTLDSFKDLNQKDTDSVVYAYKDFSSLASEYGVSKLLLVNLTQAGISRNYNGFLPLDDPHAIITVSGQVIDLSNNQLLWNYTRTKKKFANGAWDEAPSYPGLTEGYYVAMEEMKSQLVTVFNKQ